MKPKISIIVPIYNAENYLEKCIDSILNQTFKDFELILVNDGSLDNSGKICDEYAQKDKRIVVIHKTNGGLSSARNIGLDIAKGEYIGFVDSDDWIEPEMYEVLYNSCIQNKSDVSVIGINTCQNGEIIKKIKHLNKVYIGEEIIEEITSNKNNNIGWTVWNKLWKFEKIKYLRFKEGRIYEDGLFLYQSLGNINSISIENDCYYNYRTDNVSITRSNISIKNMSFLENTIDIYNSIPSKYAKKIFINDLIYYTEYILLEILKENSIKRNLNILNEIKIFYKKNSKIIDNENDLKGISKIKFVLLRKNPLLYLLIKKITKRY
ncbi:MAG: glycosyltransferase family 2 protein [Cetobacterium sp.]|uniref:glycosyltransferase family 2 protein n=1 Tax=Cetobacterium sp. TaxID=2071632 RepID=UPI003EE6EF0F